MSKLTERELKAQAEQQRLELINSIITNIASSTPATRTIESIIGTFKTKSQEITVFKVDHYSGTSERIQDGVFQYSRYQIEIGGIKISRNSYQEIIQLLGAL